MSCAFHIKNPISLICIAPHKCNCQRKLCVECLYDHRVDIKQMIPIPIFQEIVIKKLKSFELDEISGLTKQKMAFKSMLSKTESMIKGIWEQLQKSIQYIYDMIEMQNQQYLDILNLNQNIEESSYTDLEKLVQIVEGNILKLWNDGKRLNLIKLDKLKNWWGQEIKTFNEKIKKELKEILQNYHFNKKNSVEVNQLNEYTQELRGIYWNYQYNQPLQIKSTLKITFKQNKEIYYFKDGSKLRIDQIEEFTRKPEILTNLEQIQYLQWSGNYGKNNQKIGKWIATWKGETICSVGGEYSDEGKKQGEWRDMIKNYWTLAKVFEVGEYVSDQRIGVWKYIYENNEIGGGYYNKKGLKEGKWIEMSEGFWQYSQVMYNGEYNNGKKVGRWDICYRKQISHPFSKIGGGSYDETGDELKLGNWVEISENFTNSSQVTYYGEYKNGQKVGRWDIEYRKDIDEKFKKIGGGLYNEVVNGLKLGNWVEISDNFMNFSQVTYNGGYNNGKKVGRWDICYRKQISHPFSKIGGGSYDETGDELKLGNWVEISENFTNSSQVTYYGEYKNGQKVGRWNIEYREDIDEKFQKIGGGLYNEAANGLKLGNWVEISDNFINFSQVTYTGEYIFGKKAGRWDICYRKQISHPFSKMQKINIQWNMKKCSGGGSYNETGEFKLGNWVEISDSFTNSSQVTYNGEYKNGQKVGRWDIFLNQNGKSQLIGGGSYDQKGLLKLQNWIELDDGFNDCCKITYQGQYLNNKKVGRWDSYFEGNLIGGGSYNENGIKHGKWELLSDNFFMQVPMEILRSFQHGEKVGLWDIMKIQIKDEIMIFEKIGQKNYQNDKSN